jgi:hypothetical protein
MSGWAEVKTASGVALVRESGKVRLEARMSNYKAWLWSLAVEIDGYGWSPVVSGVARTQQVAQASAQLAAAALEGSAKTMAE